MMDTDATTFKFPGLLYASRQNPRNNPLPASMAVCESEVLLAIHQIAESLGSNERLKVFYLCETLDADNSADRMKETLKSKVTSSATGRLFLVELMLHLRRYDILRQVFGYSKDEVERTLRSREVLPRFRVLMTNLSDDVETKDVNSLKFLLGNILPREKTNFLDLIIELEHQDKISPERVDFLEQCLKQVGRVDLAKKLAVYKMSLNLPVPEQVVHHPCQSSVDRYTFTSNTRGVCLIIDCVGNDGEMLKHRFQSLHFNVTLHKWLSLVETVSALKGVFQGSQEYRGDSFVCCIISRGTETHLLATDTQFEGLRFKDVRRLFTGNVCAALVGKPKLFFIQSYSVVAVETNAGENHNSQPSTRENHDDEILETDAGAMASDSTPVTADVLWSHSWTSEQQLQGQHRSVYLRALTDSLGRNQERRRHVLDLHKDVNKAIFEHNKRHPDQEYHIDLKTTLRKDLYL